MTISEYLIELRSKVGSRLLVLPSVTGLVFDDGRRVLLVRHSNGSVWVAPGGAVDPDETPQDAVVRELWEETGLWVDPIRLLGVFGGREFRVIYENGDEVSYVMAVYECRHLSGQLRPDKEEILEAQYFSQLELDSLELSPWTRNVLFALMGLEDRSFIPPVTWTPPLQG
jgi:8-oxo-dGTP pyrophosphatase MutT (NUDIX family)